MKSLDKKMRTFHILSNLLIEMAFTVNSQNKISLLIIKI